ncbi:hypothetical protein Sgou_54740 [Streptomyces gougerotii]|nr:hypothetical protein Srut_16620 [Streptomyces rutgersensis]GFH70741.1 hypothetical protein Sdia_15090 [Streptomyces diastaticus subsp. diastaticus]GFH80804.1 hypothetical protein Sgou_54740 [Streptomyces gougerotii]
MTSGISASATTRPASTSVHSRRGGIRKAPRRRRRAPGAATGTGASREAGERDKGTRDLSY